MIVKFIDIGRNKANFQRKQDEEKITYDWLVTELRPYILSHEIDLTQDSKGNINVVVGWYTLGKIKIIPEGGKEEC